MTQDRFLIFRTVDGETRDINGFEITPQAQIVGIKLPYARLIWNRPTAVRVSKDGNADRIPIVNATRTAQIGIYFAAALMALVAWQVTGRRHHETTEE